ncbi:MAG TPA: ABC transporter permease [Pyrinomonadaceae bacterium]|jgi:lipopolysaccharide transport system permease protein|nr:ABC transporter permease [Pyrinomonadaceae bacterium]
MSLKTSETPEGSFNAPAVAQAPARGGAATEAEEFAGVPHVFVRSEESGVQLNLRDLWAYRELLYFLTWRDIKVRYKQTLMGAAWVIVQPLLMMLIFTLVFNKFARLDTGEVAYPLFAYSGLLVWTFFSTAVTSGTNSLISNTSLVTKVYFPRVFIPGAAVAAGLVDMAVGSLLLVALAAYYRVHVTWGVLLLPVFVLLATASALGAGMLASALTVKYRDLRHVLPFILQVWMFASPVIYPTGVVPPGWRWILDVNPMTGVLEGFRAALAGLPLYWPHVVVSAVFAVALLACAYYVFRRLEDTFADVI